MQCQGQSATVGDEVQNAHAHGILPDRLSTPGRIMISVKGLSGGMNVSSKVKNACTCSLHKAMSSVREPVSSEKLLYDAQLQEDTCSPTYQSDARHDAPECWCDRCASVQAQVLSLRLGRVVLISALCLFSLLNEHASSIKGWCSLLMRNP
jgi:hypothetical protein